MKDRGRREAVQTAGAADRTAGGFYRGKWGRGYDPERGAHLPRGDRALTKTFACNDRGSSITDPDPVGHGLEHG